MSIHRKVSCYVVEVNEVECRLMSLKWEQAVSLLLKSVDGSQRDQILKEKEVRS